MKRKPIQQRKTKRVLIHLDTQSEAIMCENVINTYQKGDLFCVMYADRTVDKFPIARLFRVREKPPEAK